MNTSVLVQIRFILTISLLLSQQSVLAQQTPDTTSPEINQQSLRLAPTSHLYSPYLADQKRVTFGFQLINMVQSDIPDTGIVRTGLRMGGRLELFNWTNQHDPQQQLQANLEVGFRGHFDVENSLDNIGWDGNYGLLLSYRHNPVVAWRAGLYHTSSHVGDEYAERTGRKRISYTREEVLLGVQFNLNPNWQYYLEAGYGYHQDEKPLQKRYRAQTGLQYQQKNFSSTERLGWYAGLDLSSYEEWDWSINRALQIGFAFDATPHVWRLALDYYYGQPIIGEFFQHNEEYVAIGLYLDI